MLLAQVLLHGGRAFESAAATRFGGIVFHNSANFFILGCRSEWKESVVIELRDDSWLSYWATFLLAGLEKSMTISFRSWLSRLTAVLVGVWVANGVAAGAGKPHYLVTNDDVPPALTSSVTFYAEGADGQLTTKAKVSIGQGGIAGG
jgi:hypothetical protein